MIAQFISNLSVNGKRLLALALLIIVVALFDRLLVSPTISRMESIDGDIVKEQNIIRQSLHVLGYKDKILKEAKAFEPYLTDTIPADEEIIAGFLKKLEMLAGKSNVTLIKVTPSPGTQDIDYLKFQADLECTGALTDIITFMHLVDTSTDLMKVVKFNFSSKKDAADLKTSMSIIKVIIGHRPASALAAEPVKSLK